MHRVKCIVHKVNYIESNAESEVHRVEYPTYLRLNRLIYISVYLYLSKAGTSTDTIDRECNPLHGFTWSSARREVKLQFVGAQRNPLQGLAWSSARTRGKVASFRRDAQPFAWIGVVERTNAR